MIRIMGKVKQERVLSADIWKNLEMIFIGENE